MPDIALDTATLAELQAHLSDGEISAVALAELCFARIDALDGGVNAIIERNPDALEIAATLDAERADGRVRGPLHGLPVVVKDNIDTSDRMTTTAGSIALQDTRAARDAHVVERLRAAGAVIVAKSNLSEWANFRSMQSSSGWSSRGGQTRNAYALDRTPGGSSSGSAVATACGFCAAAIGTETDGSVVGPAAMNGIVGLKPTVGLVSRSGIVPIAHSQDTAGPMTRSVADAAVLLAAIAGPDPADPATEGASGWPVDYLAALTPDGLRGARIGVVRTYCNLQAGVDRIFEASLAALREAGAELIDPVDYADLPRLTLAEVEVMSYEFKADLDAYLAGRGAAAPVRSLDDVIAFNKVNADRAMPYFGQDRMLRAAAKGPLTELAYREAVTTARRLSRQEGIDAALAAHGLDALVAPTTSAPWLIDWVNGDNRSIAAAQVPAVAGYPHITVPAGYLHGLPVGLSFIAGAFREATLLRLAYAFEQATNVRRPPPDPTPATIDFVDGG